MRQVVEGAAEFLRCERVVEGVGAQEVRQPVRHEPDLVLGRPGGAQLLVPPGDESAVQLRQPRVALRGGAQALLTALAGGLVLSGHLNAWQPSVDRRCRQEAGLLKQGEDLGQAPGGAVEAAARLAREATLDAARFLAATLEIALHAGLEDADAGLHQPCGGETVAASCGEERPAD